MHTYLWAVVVDSISSAASSASEPRSTMPMPVISAHHSRCSDTNTKAGIDTISLEGEEGGEEDDDVEEKKNKHELTVPKQT